MIKKYAVSMMVLCLLLLNGCQRVLDLQVGQTAAAEGVLPETGQAGYYEITALDEDVLAAEAMIIDLEQLEEGADGDGNYLYENGLLTIAAAGNYRLRGKLAEGRILIRVFEDEAVHLFLDNAVINTAQGAAIYVEKAGKTVITALEGTENILTADSKQDSTRQACIFSNTDLTVNGSGSLALYCYYADGLRSRDLLKIIGANLYIKAREDGIRGNDGVIILNSRTEVECEGSGIVAGSEKDMVVLQGGSSKVIAGRNAITARKYVAIHDAALDLYSILETVKCDGIREFDEELIP